MKEEYTITSNQDNLKLSILLYVPKTNPIGIIQIAHGMSEHKERYEDFMKYFSNKGYICIINDHRGHGNSIKSEDDYGYFYDDKAEYVVEDLHQITNHIKDRYPNLPIYLLGHSMGSLIVRKYIKKYDQDIDKLIVCGSPSQNNLIDFAFCLIKIIKLFKGDHYRSNFLNNLFINNFNKPFKNEPKNSWLNSIPEKVEEYNNDKKCAFIFTTNGFINLAKLLKDAYSRIGWELNNPNLPIMFIAGTKDPVIINESAWFNSITFLREIGYTNIKHKLYQGDRHEVLNDKHRDEVLEDLLNFLTETE